MPTGQPTKIDALNALVTLLGTIAAGSTYYTTVRQVKKFEPQALVTATDRSIYVLPESSDFENEGLKTVTQWQDSFRVRLYLVLKTNTDIVDELLRFERDVLTAMNTDLKDGTRLDGNCLRHWTENASYTLADERDSVSYAELAVRIDLRTPYNDLNTPV